MDKDQHLMSVVSKGISSLQIEPSSPSIGEWLEGYDLLLLALEVNYRDVAKLLLLINSKVNSDNQYSITPLHYAVKNGDIEIAKMLLDRNASVDAKDEYHQISSSYAIERNESTIHNLLVNQISSFEASSENGGTPIYISRENYYDIITILSKYCTNISPSSNLAPRGYIRNGYTPLHYAVEKGNWEITKLLLNNNADVNIKALRGTPLHIAAEEGHFQIAMDLLNSGADLKSICTSGHTALHLAITPCHIAAKQGQETIVKLLLEYGSDVNAQDGNGKTVLFCAVERGQSVIVEEVLKFRPDLNNESNKMSLRFAMCSSEEKHRNIVDNLLKCGFQVKVNFSDVNNHNLLHAAIRSGYLDVVAALLRCGTNANLKSEEYFTPLHTATIYRQNRVVELLINHRANVNINDKTGNTPIFYAVKNSDYNITKLLLANGAEINNGPHILNTALTEARRDIVEILLPHISEATINAIGKHKMIALETVIHAIKCTDRVKGYVAKMLLRRGADPNLHFDGSSKMLHDAARYGYVELVKALLEQDVNVNGIINKTETPLHASAQQKNAIITKMLLDKGALINAKKGDGKTALHIAVQYGHSEVAETLLEYGAEVNARAEYNTTPIHLAVQKRRHRILESLINFGADVNLRDAYGITPLHRAGTEGDRDIIISLLQNGADINITTGRALTGLGFGLISIKLSPSLRHEYIHYKTGPITAFIQHIALLKEEDLFVHEKCLQQIGDDVDLNEHYISYKKEISKMKIIKLGKSNICFYDILTKSVHQLAMYAKNESVREIRSICKYPLLFPGYEELLNYRLHKGKEREILYRLSIKPFNTLFGYELPYHVTNKVFSYLSNLDLKRLICASPDDE